MHAQKMTTMRKFLLSIVSLVVFSAILGGTLSGCEGESKQSDTLDTAVVNPAPLKSQEQLDDEAMGAETVTGEVTDGSANMVIIETPEGEQKEFNYDSDKYTSDNMYDWDLDENNKIKVTYVKVKRGDVVIDSVIRIDKAE